MKKEIVIVGPLQENCYILDINNEVLVIDPGDEFAKIKSVINGRNVLAVLVTHKHPDHIGALNNFTNIDKYYFDNLQEKEYKIGPFNFQVIFNPGHTNDSVSYYFKDFNSLFCGDFIFYHSIGRWDLPTGNKDKMLDSIKKISFLPKETLIYPGHGEATTLKEEINNNKYFRKEM